MICRLNLQTTTSRKQQPNWGGQSARKLVKQCHIHPGWCFHTHSWFIIFMLNRKKPLPDLDMYRLWLCREALETVFILCTLQSVSHFLPCAALWHPGELQDCPELTGSFSNTCQFILHKAPFSHNTVQRQPIHVTTSFTRSLTFKRHWDISERWHAGCWSAW